MSNLKLQSKSLAQRVSTRLRQAITEGEFPPGSNIAEEMLAQSFGVSRTPVREALSQLQAEGLVVIRPQVGSFVFNPDADDLALLCQFRLGVEPWAAELAYRHAREKTTAGLDAAIRGMDCAFEREDQFEFARADTAFHEAFIANCGNRYVQEAYRLVGGRVAALRTNYGAPIDVKTFETIEDHRTLARLFLAGDFAAFRNLTARLLNDAEEVFRLFMEERAEQAV